MTPIRAAAATFGELIIYLWQQRLWWLVPLVLVLGLFGVLIVVGAATGAGPFIYTFF